jgi:hypothetical protein
MSGCCTKASGVRLHGCVRTNDRLFPLLVVGQRRYPDLDRVYIDQPDRALEDPVAPSILKTASDEVARQLTEALERFSPEEWLEKHTAVSDEDFAKDPVRNRLAVVLSRTNHMSYHFGQIMLARDPH